MTGRLLLRGGCVLTLGAKTSNFTEADVLVDDGRVAEVGRDLRARDAEVVDAADTIVMPGFVDTHRHAWTSLFRNLGGRLGFGDDPASLGAFALQVAPEDVYAATLTDLLTAAEAGITSVVDWSDLPLDDACAEAALRAHADARLRTVFVHAASVTHAEASRTRDRIARLSAVAGPSTTIAFGFAVHDRDDLDLSAEAMSLARELGLRIHVHAHAGASGAGVVAALHGRGLLRHDVTFVHHTGLDEADLEAIATSGASMSFAPQSEMAEGRGAPPIQGLIDHGVRPGLGVDRELLAPGDLFAQMRATISMQHAVVFDRKLAGKGALPRLLSTRDVIRYATVDGARAAGLGGVAGSLEPGLQADIVMLRTDRPNIYPINDPIGAVVWGMDTSNIDRVFVGGRAVVREGVLDADLDEVRVAASRARDRMVAASRLVGAAERGGPA